MDGWDSNFIYYDFLGEDPRISGRANKDFRHLRITVKNKMDEVNLSKLSNSYLREIGDRLIKQGEAEKDKEIQYLLDNYKVTMTNEGILYDARPKKFIDMFNELVGNHDIALKMKKETEQLLAARERAKADGKDPNKIPISEEAFFTQALGNVIRRMFNDWIKTIMTPGNYTLEKKKIIDAIKNDSLEQYLSNKMVEIYDGALDQFKDPNNDFVTKNKEVQKWAQTLQQYKDSLDKLKSQYGLEFLNYYFNIDEVVKGVKELYNPTANGGGIKKDKLKKELKKAKKPKLSARERGISQEDLLARIGTNMAHTLKGKEYNSRTFNNDFSTDLIKVVTDTNLEGSAEFEFPNLEEIMNEMRKGFNNPSNKALANQTMDKFYRVVSEQAKTKGIKGLVFTSAKTSTLGQRFTEQGFSGTSFKGRSAIWFLQKMFAKLKRNDGQKLIAKLLNTAQGAIYGNNDNYKAQIKFELSSMIGQLLFDDFDLIGEPTGKGLNAIHIFDLNGIQVPLSTFLIAAGRALQRSKDEFYEFANVDVSTEEIEFPIKEKQGKLFSHGFEDWKLQRQDAINGLSIEVHFYKNFIDEVANAIKG